MNGWYNAETWLINLHFGEDIHNAIADGYVQDTEGLEDYINEIFDPYIEDLPPFVIDMLGLSNVDWRELFETINKDVELDMENCA